ncbi:MAG: glycosyltransferase [Planctomycetota bacterium]|nr:glycosyltransferase [Planctomycetota bacterium]
MPHTVQPAAASRELIAGDRCASRGLRVVLAHDWLAGLRGGEHVLDAIACVVDSLGGQIVELLVMFDEGKHLTPRLDALARHVSPLGRMGRVSSLARRHLLPCYPWAVSRLSAHLEALHRVRAVDLVISTSSAAIKGLEVPAEVPHLCYVHTPARYLWSQQEQYARGSLARRVGLALTGPALRAWDVHSSARPTTLLANSAHTQQLIRGVWGRESEVVHPGVRTEFFGALPSGERTKDWLVVSALEPYKRVDLAIDAAIASGARLVIAGEGSQRPSLERMARGRVEFAGRVDDERLRELYATSAMLIHPQIEDFGMVAVEAQAAGLPVAALGAGGALETVVDGVTGAHFGAQRVESLLEAVARVPRGCDEACRVQARKFSQQIFDERVSRAIGACVR